MEGVQFMLIGLAAGFLAGQLMDTGDRGLVWDLILGGIGGLLGGFLFSATGFKIGEGITGGLLAATVAAMSLAVGLRVLRRV